MAEIAEVETVVEAVALAPTAVMVAPTAVRPLALEHVRTVARHCAMGDVKTLVAEHANTSQQAVHVPAVRGHAPHIATMHALWPVVQTAWLIV